MKRKAAPPPLSDTEEKPKAKEEKQKKEDKPKPAPVNDIKLRKNRIVSDDEDEDNAPAPKPKGKGKSRASTIADALQSAEERSLRAMMDMDDGACHHPPPLLRLSYSAHADEHVAPSRLAQTRSRTPPRAVPDRSPRNRHPPRFRAMRTSRWLRLSQSPCHPRNRSGTMTRTWTWRRTSRSQRSRRPVRKRRRRSPCPKGAMG